MGKFYAQREDLLKQKSELVKFLRRQISIENHNAELLNGFISNVSNPMIKGVLKGISLESKKHDEMYKSTIAFMTGGSKALGKGSEKQRSLVEENIKMEAELIEELTVELPSVMNGNIKLLLGSILNDKKTHLSLLMQILEIISVGEAITDQNWEDIWWDMMWRDSRGST